MPNKVVTGWTQVPVEAADLLRVSYDRVAPSGGAQFLLSATFQVRDDQGVIRHLATLSQQVGAYPVSAAAILASINAAQGT